MLSIVSSKKRSKTLVKFFDNLQRRMKQGPREDNGNHPACFRGAEVSTIRDLHPTTPQKAKGPPAGIEELHDLTRTLSIVSLARVSVRA